MGILIIRILPFRVLYQGLQLSETPTWKNQKVISVEVAFKERAIR